MVSYALMQRQIEPLVLLASGLYVYVTRAGLFYDEFSWRLIIHLRHIHAIGLYRSLFDVYISHLTVADLRAMVCLHVID